MSQVTNVQTLYKVVFTEYERGWGQKHWDTEYYDNEDEARQRAIDYNNEHNNEKEVPDWCVMARYEGKVS